MNKQNLINIKFLKEIKNDKQNHVKRLNERISELIRMRDILLNDIEKISGDLIEIANKEIENKE